MRRGEYEKMTRALLVREVTDLQVYDPRHLDAFGSLSRRTLTSDATLLARDVFVRPEPVD